MINIQMATVTGYEKPQDFLGLENVQVVQTVIEDEIDATPALLINPSGDESAPQEGDRIAVLLIGNFRIAIGGLDQIAPESEQGEKRFYSRTADGSIAASISINSDGSIVFDSVENNNFSMIFGTTTIEFSQSGISITTPIGTYDALTHIHPTGTGPSGPPKVP